MPSSPGWGVEPVVESSDSPRIRFRSPGVAAVGTFFGELYPEEEIPAMHEPVEIYRRLGVRPIVNARGMNTMASGSLMPKPVLEAMTEAAGAFVDMAELNALAGAHIARLVGVEGAHVTSGSAGGLLLAAAACIAGDDPGRIARLPDTAGMRNEIVIQRCDRIQYDQALRMAGAVLVEAGTSDACTPEAMEAAISPRTAALIYIVSPGLATRGVGPERMATIAHAHGLPLIVDAAS